MSDRYRRPRSPIYNPARTSLPINLHGYDYTSGFAPPYDYDRYDDKTRPRAVPASRRELNPPAHRNGEKVMTYNAAPAPLPPFPSSTRNANPRRSSTVNSHGLKPVVHGGSPTIPPKKPYREDYYTVPASSQIPHSHHKRYSSTLDAEERARERDRLQAASAGERSPYSSGRSRPEVPYSPARHLPTFGDDYSDDGYGYTRPRDLVQYDLDHPAPHHSRRDDAEPGRRERPAGVWNYGEVVVTGSGSPPPFLDFDKVRRGTTWESTGKKSGAPFTPFDPPPWPSWVDAHLEELSGSRNYSHKPAYREHEYEREPSGDYHEVRDGDRRGERERPRRPSPRYDSPVEQRGFGIRAEAPQNPERSEKSDGLPRAERYRAEAPQNPERSEKSDGLPRAERYERPERSDRYGKSDRTEKSDRPGRSDRPDRSDDDRPEYSKGRDALAAGLGIAGGALGISLAKKARDDRDENHDRKRRDYNDDSRRSPERREERQHVDLEGRDPKERLAPRRERDADPDRRRRHSHHHKTPSTGTDSESNGSTSDSTDDPRPERRSKVATNAPQPAFNPKDTMDLRALKEALNSKGNPAPKEPTASKSPRPSATKDPVEAAKIRADLDNDRRSRNVNPGDKPHARVVSPPRQKAEEKPVKGILRTPREKFPEDLTPIREGVAPLKDAKKEGVPPDARWTKISRKLVNPEALELGNERYEARDDFVIVLRVLTRDDVQGYAVLTQKLRAAREDAMELDAREDRRRARRERHDRHKRERSQGERSERRRHRRDRDRDRDRDSESDTTEDDDLVYDRDVPKMLEPDPSRRRTHDETLMSGGLGPGTSRKDTR